MKRYSDAIAMYDRAIALNPQNLMARFKKAVTLLAMMADKVEHRDEYANLAQLELNYLKEVLPKEATVYFQLGKLLKKMKRTQEAMHYFQIALNLQNPTKEDPIIKDEISRLLSNSDDEDEEEQVDDEEEQVDDENDLQQDDENQEMVDSMDE